MTVLEQRAQAIQSVLQYLDLRSHDAHAALTFEEYEVVLTALLEGATNLPNTSGKPADPGPISPAATILRESLVSAGMKCSAACVADLGYKLVENKASSSSVSIKLCFVESRDS